MVVLGLVVALLALAPFSIGAAAELRVGRIALIYDDITDDQARAFAAVAQGSLDAVEATLGRAIVGTITIKVANSIGLPDIEVRAQKLELPASRVRGDSAGPGDRRGPGPALVHTMVHFATKARNNAWAGFLDEGLAVYLQEKLGGSDDRAMPNLGRDLHQEAKRLLADTGRFTPLDDPTLARTLNEPGCTNPPICLQQGSFARYLIEVHGLDRFMGVFDGASFESAYGQTPKQLEAAWQAFIRGLPEARR